MRLLAAALLLTSAVSADVRLPAVLSDHMMLQRDVPIRIWGKADPGEEVTVEFRNAKASTRAGSLGEWSVELPPQKAGGPYEVSVRGKNALTIRDVLVGDVWVGSGQSNMVWSVQQSDNAEKEIKSASSRNIRLFKVALKTAQTPLDDVTGAWREVASDSVAGFSAVGYNFARALHEKLNVPVALIQSAWGGTPAEAWTSLNALSRDPALLPVFADWNRSLTDYPRNQARYEMLLKEWEASSKQSGRPAPAKPAPPQGPGHQWQPGALYNAMIAPLTPMPIRGVIWYQGESNTGPTRVPVYNRLFETMIRDWREAWRNPGMPFLFVQLANFAKVGQGSRWPELREAQLQALALRNTGMAVTIDIGNPGDIHPTNKHDVGQRLALAARAVAYGEPVVHSGPLFRSAHRDGESLRLWFDHTGGGLQARGGALKSFEIAGADGKFVPAEARIDGRSIVVNAAGVRDPVAARYAWADSPEANLYNAEGLPASPFRTAAPR